MVHRQLMDLKVDYAFKALFGSERNKHITLVFLNAILKREGQDSIVAITFLNTEVVGEYAEGKQSRLDLLAETDAGERINIEIQLNNKYDMVKRSLYYWSGIYRETLKTSEAYEQLKPVIIINIVNFKLFGQTSKFHTTFALLEVEEKFRLTDVMELHFIEMPKLLRAWQAKRLQPREHILERWLLLLEAVDQKNKRIHEDILSELEAIAMQDDTLKEAFADWERLSMDTKTWWAYESRMKAILDERSMVYSAEQRGIAKGMQQGMLDAKRETARNLMSMGMPMEQIGQVIGMSMKDVQKLLD